MQKDPASFYKLYKDAKVCLDELESQLLLSRKLIENLTAIESLDLQKRMEINDELIRIRLIGEKLADIEAQLRKPASC